MNVTRWLCLFLLVFIGVPARAIELPTITVKKAEGVNLAFAGVGGSDGPAVSKVLANDLSLAGWFTIVPAAQAAYTASGTASGGSLQGKVVDHAGTTLLSKTYTGNPRTVAHLFNDDIVATLTGYDGIASSKIAFVSSHTGHKEIYTADYDGFNIQQLTRDKTISVAPTLSPDGTKLAYTSYLTGYADIYLIDLTSGARLPIVKFPGTNSGASFSPDGNRLACTLSKDGNPEVYVLNASGGGPKRLTNSRGVEASPTWGPGGREIIYVSDQKGGPQLYRMLSSGGGSKQLPTGYGYTTEPNWSPDGRRVACSVRTGGGFAVATVDVVSGSTRIVSPPGNAEDPVWGSDSRHILYSTGSSLILLDVPSGKTTTVIGNLGKVSEPTWSR